MWYVLFIMCAAECSELVLLVVDGLCSRFFTCKGGGPGTLGPPFFKGETCKEK